MNYPLISEYIEAIKSAEENFATLTNLRPVLDNDGNPIMSSGNFAVVFKMLDIATGVFYALKCFTREQYGRSEAYHLISNELSFIKKDNHNYFVGIKYLEEELYVSSKVSNHNEYPVLLMDWVEGVTLDKYIKQFVFEDTLSVYAIMNLTLDFLDFARWMSLQEIAHGDIKPDNIIITENHKLVLVDYDGMYVPKMNGKISRENGSPNYRHPNRTINAFDSSIDNFSLSVIGFSLAAIAINKDVYNKEVDDALVFSEKDFTDLNNLNLLSRISIVLHDKICSSLFSSIMMQIANPLTKIDFNVLFSIKSYIYTPPPVYLPFKLGDNAFLIYNTDRGCCVSKNIFSDIRVVNDNRDDFIMIVSRGGEIDYSSLKDFGSGPIRVTDFVLFAERQKRPKANLFALFYNKSDADNLKWYSYIKPISSSVFLVKDNDDKFGVILKDKILLPTAYKSITPIGGGNRLFFLCKNLQNDYGLYLYDKNDITNIINEKYDDKHWHYNDGASAPQNLIIFDDEIWKGYDLDRGCFIVLPSKIKRIKSYSEQILCVETWDTVKEGIRLYDVDKMSFINNDIYINVGYYKNELSPFCNGLSICETDSHKNVIVFKDGSSYIIPYETHRLMRGKNSKYVFFDYEVLNEPNYGNVADIEITIFDYRKKCISSFVYHWNSYGQKCIWVIDDKFIEISSYSMKYNITSNLDILDLNGNAIKIEDLQEIPISSTNELPLIIFDEQILLNHIVHTNYINKLCIPDIARYSEGFDCKIKNGYAVIRGIMDIDPEFGVSSELIGYADAERCYWQSEILTK